MATKLKVKMVERDYTQGSLADAVGISNTSMSQIVREKTVPNLILAMKIAKKLDSTVEELWGHLLED
ncbi:helix-turn-helix transcriptional regulator [Alicyclobacillus fastidiosus]|uniref:Helix-turn-helix domain-containing protein n=1 Tax=Alicyclobacillus fastidiosus TaxID=392011 RepID=A0ABV5AKA5_9BACL|nr:helix-turn-helix domain-containing protein [Alicyclobacillus fastidiosus]WEH09253.1 helix-turn-helix domain-containing protein [Alicyclobacillus fastidiosus]